MKNDLAEKVHGQCVTGDHTISSSERESSTNEGNLSSSHSRLRARETVWVTSLNLVIAVEAQILVPKFEKQSVGESDDTASDPEELEVVKRRSMRETNLELSRRHSLRAKRVRQPRQS